MAYKGKRPRVVIERSDEKRLLRALDSWADTGDFVALRTRAFVLLLWDGALRTKEALHLNAQDVVKDPIAQSVQVLRTVALKPRGAAKIKPRHFALSTRARQALVPYLQVVRRDGWLPTRRLEGPLFLSSYHHGKGKRLARGTAIAFGPVADPKGGWGVGILAHGLVTFALPRRSGMKRR